MVRCIKNQTKKSEFPLTLGRDFSGVVVETGGGVASDQFQSGDEVRTVKLCAHRRQYNYET